MLHHAPSEFYTLPYRVFAPLTVARCALLMSSEGNEFVGYKLDIELIGSHITYPYIVHRNVLRKW